MWVSQKKSCTRPHTNRTVFVCEALVGRMQARHSAAGIRVTASCSVSEVLKTSQSTFLSETDTRNNSWARTEEFRVLLLGEEVSSEHRPKRASMCQSPVTDSRIRHKRSSLVQLSWIMKAPTSASVMTFWLKVIAHTLSTLYSHNHRPDYTGKPTQPPPQTK